MKKSIIIGGTHGLGAEIAALLNNRGVQTFVVGRSYNASIHGEGAKLDLTDRAQVIDFMQQNANVLQSADSLYWIAGYGYKGDFAAQENAIDMIDANLTNVIPIVQTVWRKMLKDNMGTIVVVSSSTGVKARNDEAVYALTKHAQVGFARSLGLEAERLQKDIHVRLVLPGGMKTPFWDGEKPDGYETYNDPSKVARLIIDGADAQKINFEEQLIERGTAI